MWWQICTSRVRMKCISSLTLQWVWDLCNKGKWKNRIYFNWRILHFVWLSFCEPFHIFADWSSVCAACSSPSDLQHVVKSVMCLQHAYSPQPEDLSMCYTLQILTTHQNLHVAKHPVDDVKRNLAPLIYVCCCTFETFTEDVPLVEYICTLYLHAFQVFVVVFV